LAAFPPSLLSANLSFLRSSHPSPSW
jgi:hypothetical protein